jgi:uncharacterized protein
MLRAVFSMAALLLPAFNIAQGQQDVASTAVLPATHQYELRSKATGRVYVVSVALPDGYSTRGPRYPTLYVLDGKNGFALHTSFYRITHDDSLAPLIIVGIAWKQREYFAPTPNRELDFTPTRASGPDSAQSGAAPLFARFLREELFPFVRARFHVNDDRGVIGYSLGGLFAAYALIEQPDLFQRYGIGSPSLWWDGGWLLRRESALAAHGGHARGTVFMTVGDDEDEPMMKQPMLNFGDSLRAHYPGLALRTSVLNGLSHNPIIPGYLALRALYSVERTGNGKPQ